MSNSSTINVDIVVNDKGAVATVKKVGSEIDNAGKTGSKSLKTLTADSVAVTNSFGGLLKASVAITGGFFAVQGAAQAVFGEFKRGLQSIEDFNLSVASSAAFIATFSETTRSGDLAGGFREANEYATQLNTKLEMIDMLTIASGKDLQVMSETMLQHGVILDINNQKQVDGFTNIASALALVTQGQNKDIQMRQEINALLNGQIRASDRLPKLLEAVDPHLEKHLEIWKQQGTLIENVGGLLQGFSASTGNLDDLWMTVGSTMETIHNRVLRGAFKPIFEDLLGLAKDINKSLMDAEGNLTPLAKSIQDDIAGGYQTAKDLIKEYGGEVSAFAGYALAAKVAQLAFNAAVKANPYLVAASGLMILNEQMKSFDMGIESLPGKYKDFVNSLSAMGNGTRQFFDPATGKIVQEQLTEQEIILGKIAGLKNQLSGDKEWYQFQLFKDPAEEKRHITEVTGEIAALESQLKGLADARDLQNEIAREKGRAGSGRAPKLVIPPPDNTAELKKHAEELLKLEEKVTAEINQQKLSRYQYAVWAIDQEVAKMRETAGANKKLQDEITQYRQAKLTEAAEFGNMYASDEQKRLVDMKDTFMQMEELKGEATQENYQKQMALEEELNVYLENAGNDRLGSELARLEKQYQKKLEVAGSDMELQAKVAEWYRLKQEEIQKDAWKTERDLLLSSGKIADGFHAAILEIKNDYITMGDVAYDTFMDIRDTFRSEVGNYLVEQFGGIEGEWGGLWDRALQSFGSFLADMVMKWAAAIAEIVAIWAATELARWWTGNNSFSFNLGSGSGSGGGGIGGMVVNAAASAAVDAAATEVLGTTISEYIMSEVVYPAIAEVGSAITGSTSASAAATASSQSGVISSGQATPAIMDAYAGGSTATGSGVAVTGGSYFAGSGGAATGATSFGASEAAAAGASSTAASGSAAGGAATAGASAATMTAAIAPLAFIAIAALTQRGDWTSMLGGARPEELAGTGLTSNLQEVSIDTEKALAHITSGLGEMQNASIDAANGIAITAGAILGEDGLVRTMNYTMATFDQASGTWINQNELFNSMVEEMQRLGPQTTEAIQATASYIAEMNGVPSVADELIMAFSGLAIGMNGVGVAAIDAAGNMSSAAAALWSSANSTMNLPSGIRHDEYIDMQAQETADQAYDRDMNYVINPKEHGVDLPVREWATGGDHPGGWRIVGERGWEIEATGKSRIFNHAQSKDILSGSGETAKQIAELKDVIISAVMISSERMRKIENTVDRWEKTGLPAARG